MRPHVLLALLALANVAAATDLESAHLVQSVYVNQPVEGWHALTEEDLRNKGINADLLQRGEQWRGIVYERGDEMVMAWAGNLGGDEGLVIAQEFGVPMPEFLEAAAIGRALVQQFPDKKISFAGHSMGGGFASAAAVATGKPAVLFNGQALHRNTLQAIGGEGPGEIRHYQVAFDYATMMQSLPFFPKPMGQKIKLPNLGWDPMTAHNMPEVIKAMISVGIP